MPRLKLRPLHRQRSRRRNSARVLDEQELARCLGIDGTAANRHAALKRALADAGWDYHEDAGGRLWASVPAAELERRNLSTEHRSDPGSSGSRPS